MEHLGHDFPMDSLDFPRKRSSPSTARPCLVRQLGRLQGRTGHLGGSRRMGDLLMIRYTMDTSMDIYHSDMKYYPDMKYYQDINIV